MPARSVPARDDRFAIRVGALGALLAGLAALAISGCGAEREVVVPVGCKTGPDALRRALEDAPAGVSLQGTPLSDCVASASDQADLQTVGVSFVDVAADLASGARTRPEGPEALQLGYLVGAARSGAVPGIHDELVRRLEQELTGVDTGSRAFKRGEQAGREG